MLGINLMPFAIGFFILFGIGYGYYTLILNTSGGLFSKLISTITLVILLIGIIILTRKYWELKRKYSTLFDLKEKLDKFEEL
jgi:hypothetical protein